MPETTVFSYNEYVIKWDGSRNWIVYEVGDNKRAGVGNSKNTVVERIIGYYGTLAAAATYAIQRQNEGKLGDLTFENAAREMKAVADDLYAAISASFPDIRKRALDVKDDAEEPSETRTPAKVTKPVQRRTRRKKV